MTTDDGGRTGPARVPPPRRSPVLFRRIRQLRVSLAVKCQLLFGAAAVLIISTALFIPWTRMQQWTDQLNEKSAAALTTNAVAEHVERETARLRMNS